MKSFQRSILYGSVLGDSYISKNGKVEFRQSLDKKEYVEWSYNHLSDWTTGNGVKMSFQYDIRTNKMYSSCRFATRAICKDLRELFYPEGVKILPLTFYDDIDPIALAVWFMDDGARTSKSEKAVFFTMDSFTTDEIELVRQVFREKFSIDTTFQKAGVTKKGNPQYRIRGGVKSYPTFYNHVYPIVSQVKYMKDKKLPDI